jgi:hypothetical protein
MAADTKHYYGKRGSDKPKVKANGAQMWAGSESGILYPLSTIRYKLFDTRIFLSSLP